MQAMMTNFQKYKKNTQSIIARPKVKAMMMAVIAAVVTVATAVVTVRAMAQK
jgi:hypothetical protein